MVETFIQHDRKKNKINLTTVNHNWAYHTLGLTQLVIVLIVNIYERVFIHMCMQINYSIRVMFNFKL